MRSASRTVVAALLRRRLPPHALSSVLGDLDEEFADRATTRGRLGAEIWMLRQAWSVRRAYGSGAFLRDLAAGFNESFRHLARAPGYAALAAGGLGLAVAAIVSTAAVSDSMLGRPVAYEEPERVLRLTSATTSGTSLPFAFPELDAVRAHLGPSDAVAAVALTPALLRVGDATSQDLIDVSVGAIHDVLGVRALRGRLLAANDDLPGRPRVLVVSEQYWRTHLFGADDVIGRQVMVNGLDYTVIGVAPTMPSVGFFGVSAAGWVAASGADSLLNPGWRTNPNDRAFIALIKLHHATPAGLASLEGALGRATGDLAQRFPDRWRERRVQTAEGLLVTGNLRRTSIVIASLLSAVAALLLVVAATNVGGLVFAQAAARRRATAIKVALGARPGTLVVGTLIEGLVLGVLAGVVALALYLWFAGLAQSIDILPTVTLRLHLPWDWRIVSLTAAVSMGAGLATAVIPALTAARLASTGSLDSLTARQAGDPTSSLARRWLLGAQVAAAVVLIVIATLFARSLDSVDDTAVGIDIERLAAFDFDIAPPGLAPEALRVLAGAAHSRVGEVAGVAAVAMASRAPVDQSTPGGDVRAVVQSREVVLPDVTRQAVTPEYFDTVGLRRLDGRLFSVTDGSRQVAIVNETLARRLEQARTFVDVTSGRAYDVVGVVSNTKYRTVGEPPQPHFYTATGPDFHMALIVRTEGDPARVFQPVQQALDGTGPGIQGFFPRTGRDHLRPALLPAIVSAAVARTLGLIAGALATVGLFGLLSSLVQSRRHEWGLRVAIGASPRDLRRLVVGHAWRAAWPGALAGIAGAAVVASLARGQLFGVTVLDPVLLATVPALVIGVVLIASWLPARRAMRVSPTELLR